MKILIKKIKKDNRGFTLVEALIAVSIFTIAVLTMLVVLADGISDTNYAKRKTTAIYLSQEGLEVFRNMRDTYMVYDALGWDAFETKITSGGCTGANGCFYNDSGLAWTGDPTQPIANLTLTPCSSSTCTNGALSYDPSTGKYGASGTSSGFTRQIRATVVTSGSEARIRSTVYWVQGTRTFQMTFSDNLFNWAE